MKQALNLLDFSLQMFDVYQNKKSIQYLADKKKVKIARLLLKRFNDMAEMIKILQIPFKGTIALQKRDLTLPDAYGLWLQMTINLRHPDISRLQRTNLANLLSDALNERKKVIFDNSLMQCALFLDPRYRREVLRNRDIVEGTVQKLANLWNRINSIREADIIESTTNCSAESSNLNMSFNFNDTDALERYLARGTNASDTESPTAIHRDIGRDMSIEFEIEQFQPEKLPVKSNLITYWESMKFENPRLYEIAMILYAIPPTEVEIERDFSHLEFIYTSRRYKLSPDLLEAILVIHLNSDLFFIIKQEELSKIVDAENFVQNMQQENEKSPK